LEVWKRAIQFARGVVNLSEEISSNRKHYRLVEQLESASTSVAMNIAEGKGRYSKKEFVQHLYIARGSLFETLTLLRIFHENNWIADAQLEELENCGEEINKMLLSLIKRIRESAE